MSDTISSCKCAFSGTINAIQQSNLISLHLQTVCLLIMSVLLLPRLWLQQGLNAWPNPFSRNQRMCAVHSLVCTYFKMIWWQRWYQVQQRFRQWRPWRPLPKPSSSEWKRKWFSCTNEHSEPTNDDDQLLLPNHLLNQHELNFVNFSVQNLGTTKLAWTFCIFLSM